VEAVVQKRLDPGLTGMARGTEARFLIMIGSDKARFMRQLVSVIVIFGTVCGLQANIAARNSTGVPMSQVGTIVRDLDVTEKFGALLGGTPPPRFFQALLTG
jgi:hypothetical protein